MKTLRNLCILITAISILSCDKEAANDEELIEVSFGITQVDPLAVKSDQNTPACRPDMLPDKAHIIINGESYFPDVTINGGKLYTQVIKLPLGNYTVSQFWLLDAASNILMAIPDTDSDYAQYVETPVSFPLVVERYKKVQMEVELLCYDDAWHDEFGFTWFYTGRIALKELYFYGDLCIDDAADYQGTLYANDGSFPSEGIYDAPAIFKVVVKKDDIELEQSTFGNEAWLGIEEPVCVTYTDRMDVEDEVFTFELWVLVPSTLPGVLTYQLYTTFTTTDGNPLDQVIDDQNMMVFSIGDCAYNPDNNIIVLPWLDPIEPTSVSAFGFRMRGLEPHLLGVGDLDPGNYVQKTTYQISNGLHTVRFSYDSTTSVITLNGPYIFNLNTKISSYDYPQCGNYNALVIMVNDEIPEAAVEWRNITINERLIDETFVFFDKTGSPGYKEWVIIGDFTQSFNLTAQLVVRELIYNDAVWAGMFIKCYS